MCEICEHTKTRVNIQVNARNVDPTRTLTLRNAFVRSMNRRFNELTRVVRIAIVDEDVFGIAERAERGVQVNLSTPGRHAFKFLTSQQKVNQFMAWFNSQVELGILESTTRTQLGSALNPAWTDKYVLDSYKRGVIRARYELEKAGFSVPTIDESGGINAVMNGPFHLDRVGILYARTFNGLRGITAAMDTQVSRVLAQGMADGDGPRLLARKLIATINGTGMGDLALTDSIGRFIPAKRRAEILARTEIIRAHHQATIQEYKNWGVAGVVVQAEWRTAGDNRVCSICESMEGNGPNPDGSYPLDVIQNMIPAHAQCRCIALPFKTEVPVQPETTVPEYVKAKHLASARRQLSKMGINGTKVIGQDVEIASKMAYYDTTGRAMNDIRAVAPKLLERMAFVNKNGDQLSAVKEFIMATRDTYLTRYGQVMGRYIPNRRRLEMSGLRKMLRTKPNMKLGGGNAGTDYASTVRHEVAHHAEELHSMYRWETFFNSKPASYWRQNVSRYATTDYSEAFAESFSAWTSPVYKESLKKLPSEIEKMLRITLNME